MEAWNGWGYGVAFFGQALLNGGGPKWGVRFFLCDKQIVSEKGT